MPIDIGAGFALMGQSVAQTAQAAALEMIRSEAEERRVKLANDLADARESKGRAETQAFQTSEREAKERFETPERDAKIASQKAQTNQAQTATDIAKDKWSRQTRAGAEMAGVLDGKGGTSKSYTDRIAQFESGGGKMVPNELGSGAYGPYQFMPGTWSDVRAKNTDLGLPADMRQATPEQHKAAFDRFTAGNADALKRAGIEPTAANLYLAHRFGPAGAEKVIKADENAPLGNVLPGDWQQQNPDMRGQTAGGFKRLAEERMKGVTLGDGGTTGTGGALSKIPSDVKTLIASAAKSGDVDKVLELTMKYLENDQGKKPPSQLMAEWYSDPRTTQEQRRALETVIAMQRERTTPSELVGYEPDPNRPGGLRPTAGGPRDPKTVGDLEAAKEAAKNKPLTEDQAKAAGFSDRLLNSNAILFSMDKEGKDPWGRALERAGTVGNMLQSEAYQKFKQARDDFINAELRRESGAAIGQLEYDRADKQYFPMPGDSTAVLEQKAKNRQIAVDAMIRSSGQNYKPGANVGTMQPTDAGRQVPAGENSRQFALPPVNERKIGTVYDTPTGPAIWMGGGWARPQPGVAR